ncbi:hypothetical protein [Limibacillus halophilus]|uniref:GIY-YIG catalytic domain-containing protein n=1 Tax=Limibacillus halophilus TaxID=1579333 RepID=A0A839SRC6_9PROT|nr:hypothetical protein [Limibacillus halophilus]MBB3065351.1 hypothetical protein [Limibacillus halophilus]
MPIELGIYRFCITHEGTEARYIGEAASLRSRFHGYRTPGKSQVTSLRINKFLTEQLHAGAQVAVFVATSKVSITAEGQKGVVDLSDKATRRMFEHFAQVLEQDAAIDSLN